MNRRQRITVFVAALIVAAMLLFPPMSGRGRYGFLFSKRSTYIAEYDHWATTLDAAMNGWVYWDINREMLVFQILIVLVLTGGITVLLGTKRE